MTGNIFEILPDKKCKFFGVLKDRGYASSSAPVVIEMAELVCDRLQNMWSLGEFIVDDIVVCRRHCALSWSLAYQIEIEAVMVKSWLSIIKCHFTIELTVQVV